MGSIPISGSRDDVSAVKAPIGKKLPDHASLAMTEVLRRSSIWDKAMCALGKRLAR